MSQPSYAEHIKKRWKTVLLFGVITFFLVTAFIIFFLPFEFRADTQVFIMTRETSFEAPSYAVVATAERLGENITHLIETSRSLDYVMEASGGRIDRTFFPENPRKQLNKWKRSIQTSVVPGTGLLRIAVFHPQRDQAALIAQTIADVLATHSREYTGFDLEIRQVDAVFTSTLPARPSIPLNALLSFLLGCILGSIYVVAEQERLLKL
ncbi:MAG TPA: hypothetical protein DDW36_03280 [Candidatus Magasanikbacteria bacterium]|nr:hypothetical protein [Candidatus Magasanikbacteria bacterium]